MLANDLFIIEGAFRSRRNLLPGLQTAADIVNQVVKKLIDLCVEGAKVLDICVEGDKLLEEGTGAVYNKAVKGVKVQKGGPQPYPIV